MSILNKLTGGDLRSIGNADEVVVQIGNNQELFDELFHGIFHNEPLIRMRAADAAEKVSAKYPHLLTKHKQQILNSIKSMEQQEVKWHIALMLSYLELSKPEVEIVINQLIEWGSNKNDSKIVRVNSMQAFTDIALKTAGLNKKPSKS